MTLEEKTLAEEPGVRVPDIEEFRNDEKVYVLESPGYKNNLVAMGAALDFPNEIVGLFYGVKNVVAPSVHTEAMAQEFGEAKFLNLGNGYGTGFVTNMRFRNPQFKVLNEDTPNYKDLQRELLAIRAERPKTCLELEYSSQKGLWTFQPLHPATPMDSSYSYFKG